MELVVWALAGAMLGWAGCAFLGLNAARGTLVVAASAVHKRWGV